MHFFFSSRRRHTRFSRDWSSDVCSSDLQRLPGNSPTSRHRGASPRRARSKSLLTRKIAMTANDVVSGDVLTDYGLVIAVEYIYSSSGKHVRIATVDGTFTVPAHQELIKAGE